MTDEVFQRFTAALRQTMARQVVPPEEYYGAMIGVERLKAFTVSGLASMQQIEDVLGSLSRAIADGESFAQWKTRIASGDAAVGLSRYRLETIFRTNAQGAYAAGRHRAMLRRARTRPFWMYNAIRDARVRPSHLAIHGVIKRFDDPWWVTHFPPNGFSCRCTVVALTEAEAERRGITVVTPDGQPDAGWDYSPGQDVAMPGHVRAIQNALDSSTPGSIGRIPEVRARLQRLEAAVREGPADAEILVRGALGPVFDEVSVEAGGIAATRGIDLASAAAMAAYARSPAIRSQVNAAWRYIVSARKTVPSKAEITLPILAGIFRGVSAILGRDVAELTAEVIAVIFDLYPKG